MRDSTFLRALILHARAITSTDPDARDLAFQELQAMEQNARDGEQYMREINRALTGRDL